MSRVPILGAGFPGWAVFRAGRGGWRRRLGRRSLRPFRNVFVHQRRPLLLQRPDGVFQLFDIGHAEKAHRPFACTMFALAIAWMAKPLMGLAPKDQVTTAIFVLMALQHIDVLGAVARHAAPWPVPNDQETPVRNGVNGMAGDLRPPPGKKGERQDGKQEGKPHDQEPEGRDRRFRHPRQRQQQKQPAEQADREHTAPRVLRQRRIGPDQLFAFGHLGLGECQGIRGSILRGVNGLHRSNLVDVNGLLTLKRNGRCAFHAPSQHMVQISGKMS